MASKHVVQRLEDKAFEVSFRNIMANLLICRSHRPESKQLPYWNFPSLISSNPLYSSENIIKSIRDSLDYHLVGVMNDETRKKYVEKFYHLQQSFMSSTISRLVDVWAFLDCVLDESFQELTTHIAFPGSEPNPKLITTIAERATSLKQLQINFVNMKKDTAEAPYLEKAFAPVFLSLSALNCLTSLSLFMLPESHKSTLKYLGSCCPLLSHLCVTGFTIEKRDILAIILGDLIDDLLPNDSKEAAWSDDTVIQELVVPPKFLSPLCISLRHLLFTDFEPKNDWPAPSKPYDPIGFSDSTLAFALRHLSSLEEFDGAAIKSNAIKILHRSGATNQQIQSKFSEVCLEAFSRRETPVEPINLEHKPFSGSLQLTDLGIISVLHKKALQCIQFMCPFVKNAVFCEESVNRWRPSGQLHRYPEKYNGEMSSDDLEAILKGWPKLESVTITGVSPSLVKSILNVFGPHLKHLTLESCKEINLQDLVPCLQLESLCILLKSTLDLGENEQIFEPESFLPQLKILESDICLGAQSRLFEEKPDLTRVVLNCYHIGLKKGGILSQPDWSKLPKVWTKLETLHIRQCPALTTDMVVSNFVPQLTKLKEICLPNGKEEEEDERQDAIVQLANRASPVILKFEEMIIQKCAVIQSKIASKCGCGGQCANDRDSDDSDNDEEASDGDSDNDGANLLQFILAHFIGQDGTSDESDESGDESDQDDGDSDTDSDDPPELLS